MKLLKTLMASSLFLLVFGVFIQPAHADPSAADAQTIELLISYIKLSGFTFIRNGHEHDAKHAGEHIQEKYAQVKSSISSPEDFIEKAASRSLLSGKPYLVRLPDGTQMEVKTWLMQELKKYREQSH